MKITNLYSPNTTVLLPGSCNAKCYFCFWNRDEAKIRPPEDYLAKVFQNLDSLPKDFQTLSISGGEPTLSRYFQKFLTRLAIFRRHHHDLERVVLTTNGANLDKFVSLVGCSVDHINISRHDIGTVNNRDVFNTESVPSDEELSALITKIHYETSCDVTLNCVIDDTTHWSFAHNFIQYAQNLGADAVSFRKKASDVEPTSVEKRYRAKYGVLSETACPVCRGVNQDVDGYDVRWKGTVAEPSLDTDGVYELIIHPDGEIYRDWGMTSKLTMSAVRNLTKKEPQSDTPLITPKKSAAKAKPTQVNNHRVVGCGSSGCGRITSC